MKVLYLAADSLASRKGAAVRIRRTVETYRALGHEVDVFTTDGLSLPAENFLDRVLAFRREAERWLEGRKADLVQVRSIWEGVPAFAHARRMGACRVLEAHGFPSIELRSHFPGLRGDSGVLPKMIAEENALLREADRVVTPSHTGERFLMMRGVRPEAITVIPNAVDPDLFSPGPAPPPDEPPHRLVYQGTLAPWQGLDTLLEAMVSLRAHTTLEFHLIGPLKADWRRALRARARQLRVHHALHLSDAMEQQDLAPVLRTAHICLAPLPADARNAVQGCCPIKLLEYMAAGRPILSTRIDPVEEVLEHGRTAHLVRPGSPAALAEGLRWMLAHPQEREALGTAARNEALACWTPGHFRERTQGFLAQVAGAKASAP